MQTTLESGTSPEALVSQLQVKGLKIAWGEDGNLDLLKRNLQYPRPTLVLWTDWGHWVAVVDYDDRGTLNLDIDDIILADPYDRIDGSPEGLTFFNAERFESMWFDANHFGWAMQGFLFTCTLGASRTQRFVTRNKKPNH